MSEIRDKIVGLKDYMDSRIIGQKDLVKKMIITLLAEGHALVEGAPGLAKTKAIKTLADCISASFNAGSVAVGHYRQRNLRQPEG